MTLLALVLAVAFTLLMILQMFRPFLYSRDEQLRFELLEQDLREIENLLNRKQALVQMLRDLEYDYETDKIAEDHYRKFRRSCERQAVAVMRRLDSIHGGRGWESLIDQALATDSFPDSLPQAPPAPTPPIVDEDLPSTPGCDRCGTLLEPQDRFCGHCGSPVVSPDDSDPAAPFGDDVDDARESEPSQASSVPLPPATTSSPLEPLDMKALG